MAGEGREIDGAVVAYPPGIREGQFAREGELELSRLAVARHSRGRGLGKRLVGIVLQEAERKSAARVVLWSQAHQVEAHRLYESLGFRRAPERDGDNHQGQQLVYVTDLPGM